MKFKLDGKSTAIFYAAFALFFGAFLFYPISYALVRAFQINGRFTLSFVLGVLADPVQRESIANSFLLGAAVTATSTLVALPLAWATVKFQFPGKPFFSGLLLVPMILPPFVGAIGMRVFFARYYGSANLFLAKLGLTDGGHLIDWFGEWGFFGVVILQTLHLYPIMYLNLSAALANIDPAMEDAARNLGSRGLGLFRRITFPLMLPGFFAGATLVFIWAFTDLGTPLMFGYRRVMAVQIFDRLVEMETNPQGYALVVVVLVTTLALFLASKQVIRGQSFSMMSKGTTAASERRPGPLAMAALYAMFLAVIGAAMIPHLGVVMTSLSKRWFMTLTPDIWTLDHYGSALSHPLTLPAIRNSILYSSLSTLVDVVLGLWIGVMLVRRKIVGAAVLDAIVMLPLALPGIVLAFGYVGAFGGASGTLDLGFFQWRLTLDPRENPVALLVISYSVRRLPYMVRAVVAGLEQVSESFEEASLNLGATPAQTTMRITVPLIGANLVAGTILAFSFAMLEVSDSLLLVFKEPFYPITKAIYQLFARLDDGPYIASALGVWAMAFLTLSLMGAALIMGRKMGEMFRG
ncbi:MAG: iron ABC transporter permease [Planctomycetes bacterium]|nr:iron ABC transporter permease [Planctomycetota bacterium]